MTELGSANLNMLQPLSALLEYRSVSEAAKQMHVGQPAMSAALAKLRRHYDDELLVRVGPVYELTPLAESLREVVAVALDVGARALAVKNSTLALDDLHRAFTIGVSEYELALLGKEILSAVREVAPNVHINFELNRAEHMTDYGGRLRLLDCMIGPQGWAPDHPSTPLFTDSLCCVVSADNDDVPVTIDRAAFADLKLVFGHGRGLLHVTGSRLLNVSIREEQIVASSDSLFGQVLSIVGTDLACVIPRRLLPFLPLPDSVRIVEIPSVSVPIRLALTWHPTRTKDPGLTWLRGVIAQASARYRASNSAPELAKTS